MQRAHHALQTAEAGRAHAGDRVAAEAKVPRGAEERQWFADWSADFDEAQREGDSDTTTLPLDTLVAFNAWLGSRQDPNT